MGAAESDVHLRVNFAPYLLTLDLLHPIDDFSSSARFLDGTLILRLPKASKGATWPSLEVAGLAKTDLAIRRREAAAKREAREAEVGRLRSQRKQEASDLAFRRQMALEEAERAEVESRIASEKAAAEVRSNLCVPTAMNIGKLTIGCEGQADVYAALERVQAAASRGPPAVRVEPDRPSKAIFRDDDDDDNNSEDLVESSRPSSSSRDAVIERASASRAASAPAAGGEAESKATYAGQASVPAPSPDQRRRRPPPPRHRTTVRAGIRFTERAFPTPLRASRLGALCRASPRDGG